MLRWMLITLCNMCAVIVQIIAVGVGLHAGPHLTCNFPWLLHASEATYEPMKPFFGDKRPSNSGGL